MCSFSFSCSLPQFSFQFSALFLPADSSLFPSVSFRYSVSSDCRFFFSSFPSEKLPSSLRFLMLRLNFALTIPLSVPRRPFLLPNLSLRQSAVLAFFRPLTQELMLRSPSALALSSTARPPLISKLPAPASLPGLSPVRASLGDSFGRFLPTHLRASRPTALLSSPAFLPSDLVHFRSRSAMHLSSISASLAAFLSPGFQLHPGLPKLHPTTLLSVPLSLPLLTALFASRCFQLLALFKFPLSFPFPFFCSRSLFALNTSLRLCPPCFPLSLSPGSRLGLPLPCAFSCCLPSSYF